MMQLVVGLVVLGACGGAVYHAPATATPLVLPEPGTHAVAIVEIPAPWYARTFIIRRKFRGAVPEYERIAGLERKYFTITTDREFGGIYLWQSRAIADAYYDPAWRKRVHDRYGRDAKLVVLAAPFVVEGTTTLDAEPIDAHATAYPAAATFLDLRGVTEGGEAGLRKLAALHGCPPGLVRAYFVIDAPSELGVVALWASEDLAAAHSDPRPFTAALGGTARVTRFEAPVLLDNPH